MQNSYGRLEQSYMKCSPIFPGMTSDSRGKEQNSELIQNFPLSSMLQNKTAVIRSNFDINADMMTPYYKRANHLEEQEENEIAESQEEEGFISEQHEAPVHQKEKNSLTTRTSQRTNQNQQGVSLNSSLFGGVRASNSAFLLNYQANTKTASKHFDSGPGNIQNSFSHIYSNLNNNFNGLKPHSSIFLGKNMDSQKNAPVNLTIINNNNYNMQNFQPKIREVIKIAGYEKNKKNKINKKSGIKSLNSKTSKLKKVNRKSENEKMIKQKGKISNKINENDDVSMISSNFEDEEKEYSEIIQSDKDESATEEKESLDNKKKEGTRKQKKKNIPKVEEKTEIVLPSNRIEKSRKTLSKKKKKSNNNNIKIKSLLDNDQVKSDIEMLSSEVEENFEDSDSEEVNESSLEESENSEQIQSENSDQEEEISEEDDYVSNSLQRSSKQDFFNRKKKSYLQKKTKSIRDLVDSTKKIIEEKRPKGRKQPEEEKEKVYVFNNIETNKYTKKIAQDTFNRNFPNIHYKKGDYDSSSAFAGLNNHKYEIYLNNFYCFLGIKIKLTFPTLLIKF